MRKITQNTFNQGLKMDLNPLTTPNDILTDCLNGTIITYNGNEFVLQNDMGNCKVDTARLKPGFIPMGMKEYGGIIYVVSYNPVNGLGEFGCFPSPQRDFSTTDYAELGPVNFRTNEFVLETNTTTETSTKYAGKLSQPELFELHPGDLYVIVYTIHEPNAPDSGLSTDLNTTSKMNNYISKDPANRKLFRLKFYKITNTNKLTELDPTKIKVIEYQPDISEEYVYFTENSNSTLVASLEFEQLDTFDANIIDTSLRTHTDKTVVIESIGQSASLADFQGVKVNITQPTSKVFYLDKATGTKKASAIVSGLSAGDNFQCSITPYCNYALYPKLRKDFKLTIGEYLSSGSGVNNIFQYYTDYTAGTFKLDFDFKFQGNNPEGLHLYVELYDPWSDYSIVKRIDNPTYYGLNSVILDLVDEPRIDQFDSTTVGGTPPNKLITNLDTTYEKTLLNSTNKVRTTTTLRKNHFYIVRVSGVDQDTSTGSIVYTHYDFYKGVYTSDMFNGIYTTQSALSVDDPAYISDFNSIDFDITNIGYSTTITPSYSIAQPPVIENYPNAMGTDPVTGLPIEVYPLMTGNNYYAVRNIAYTGGGTYKYSKTYETDAEYNVQLALQGVNKVFGTFKSSMLSYTFPTLIATDSGGSGYKPTITEQTIPSTPTTGTRADWISTSLGGLLYKVNLKAFTSRSVSAPITHSMQTGVKYSAVSIMKSFSHFPNGDGPLSNGYATIEISRDPTFLKWIDPSGTMQTATFSLDATTTSRSLYTLFETYSGTKEWSAWWGCCYNRARYWWWNGAPGDYGGDTGDVSHRNNILFFRNPFSGFISACRTHDINVAKDFFNTVKVASNIQSSLYLYYPDNNSITKNGQLVSTLTFNNAPITTTFSPDVVLGSPVKTYLSNFRFRALNNISEFNPTIINNYITSRISDSIIVDSKQTIRDGFIPFITSVKTTTFNLVFDDIVINQSADSDIFTAFINGQTIGLKDAVFSTVPDAKPHGTLFSNDSTKYTSYLGKFGVANVTTGVEVNPETVYIYLKDAGEAQWSGYHRVGGSPKRANAPDLLVDFQMS